MINLIGLIASIITVLVMAISAYWAGTTVVEVDHPTSEVVNTTVISYKNETVTNRE